MSAYGTVLTMVVSVASVNIGSDVYAQGTHVVWDTKSSGVSDSVWASFRNLRSNSDDVNAGIVADQIHFYLDNLPLTQNQYALAMAELGAALDSNVAMQRLLSPEIRTNLNTDETGRVQVVQRPGYEGWSSYFTSLSSSGDPGDLWNLSYAAADTGTKYVDMVFSSPVELHDGEVLWNPECWGPLDTVSIGAIMPATSVTSVSSGGNAVLSGTAILPASSGAYQVDLTTAVPIPDANGPWSVDYVTGVISAGSGYSLLTTQVGKWMVDQLMLGYTQGTLSLESTLVRYFHPKWRLRLQATRAATSSVETVVGGRVHVFRA